MEGKALIGQQRFAPLARRDLREVWRYIAADNPDEADRLVESLHASVGRLAENPRLGRPREELGKGIRSLAVGNYVIFYRPMKNGVRVVRVLHGARDVPGLF